jgi:hypothetical protein
MVDETFFFFFCFAETEPFDLALNAEKNGCSTFKFHHFQETESKNNVNTDERPFHTQRKSVNKNTLTPR